MSTVAIVGLALSGGLMAGALLLTFFSRAEWVGPTRGSQTPRESEDGFGGAATLATLASGGGAHHGSSEGGFHTGGVIGHDGGGFHAGGVDGGAADGGGGDGGGGGSD